MHREGVGRWVVDLRQQAKAVCVNACEGKRLPELFRSSRAIGVVAGSGEIVAALVRGEAGKGLPDGSAQIWVGAGFRDLKQCFQ